MPPKQQDMSVRDEDQLARDQSLDQLKDQLRASLGYEGGADGLVVAAERGAEDLEQGGQAEEEEEVRPDP